MIAPVQTSFIPKQNLSATGPTGGRGSGISLWLLLSIIIFALSVATWAGAYSYRYYLLNQINRPCSAESSDSPSGCGLRASLDWYKERLTPELLSRYESLDAKFTAAETLLDRHTAFLPLLNLLGSQTLKAVQYKDFRYGPDGLSVKGLASSYEDVAVQSAVLKEAVKNKDGISDFSVSDISLDDKGKVSFTLLLKFDPKATDFKQSVGDYMAPPATSSATTTL